MHGSPLQYVTRPFVAGDHVKLINQEGVEVEVRGSTGCCSLL